MPDNDNETEETLKPVTKKRKSYGIGCRRRYEMYLLKADPTGAKTLDFQEWAEINC